MSSKKKINQIDADVQVALQNSHGNDIKIINSPIDYVDELLYSGELEKAAKLFGRIYKLYENAHPVNPYYIFKPVSLGKKIVFDHVPVNEQASIDFPLKYKGKFTIVDKKNSGEEKTFDELLNEAFVKQEEIEINIKDIETWIGDRKIDDDGTLIREAVKCAKWTIKPKELPPPMKVKIVKENDIDDITIFDYIELSLSDIDNENIVLDNSKQTSSPHLITVKIKKYSFYKQDSKDKLVRADSKINVSIKEEHKGNISAIYKLEMFILNTLENQNFRLVNLETDKDFVVVKNYKVKKHDSISKIKKELDFLRKLIKIEKHFNVKFSLPEKLDARAHKCIEILFSIIEDRLKEGIFDELILESNSKRSLGDLISHYEKKDNLMVMTTQLVEIELFGQTITGIERKQEFNNVCLKEPEKIKRKYTHMEDGETVKVKLIPGSNNQLIETYRYINDEE